MGPHWAWIRAWLRPYSHAHAARAVARLPHSRGRVRPRPRLLVGGGERTELPSTSLWRGTPASRGLRGDGDVAGDGRTRLGVRPPADAPGRRVAARIRLPRRLRGGDIVAHGGGGAGPTSVGRSARHGIHMRRVQRGPVERPGLCPARRLADCRGLSVRGQPGVGRVGGRPARRAPRRPRVHPIPRAGHVRDRRARPRRR